MGASDQRDTAEMDTPARGPGAEPPRPFSSLVRVDLAGLSDRGLVRSNNEDHFLCVRFGRHLACLGTNLPEGQIPPRSEETGYAVGVADGMGGHVAGEEASRLALGTLVNLVLRYPDWILRLDDEAFVAEVMRRAAERCGQIQAAMTEQARADPNLQGFGTTLTVAWSLGKDLFLCHVGDSRAYLWRRGKLCQLTHDHTLAQSLADAGHLTQQEVATHRYRHVLTRALGVQGGAVEPDVLQLALEDGDWLLLCSDGLSDMVPDERIADLLGGGRAAGQVCQDLVREALQAGGRDNVTVVVARYEFPAPAQKVGQMRSPAQGDS
jgi:protein phosphatase